MNWQVILSIISIIISIFTLLFFSVYPCIKKTMINKSFIRIENFYNVYSYLNPCFRYKSDEIKNITLLLMGQSLFAEGFPKFRYLLIEKNHENFDPFTLQDTNWANKLTIKEILYFYSFWKKAFKKIEYIKKTINKYEYIVYVDYGDWKQITYRDSFIEKIEISSISLCPSFHETKLHGHPSGACGYKEVKFNLDEINKLENNKEFIKELKSTKFSVNLRFKSEIKDKIYHYHYSYSVIFNDKSEIEIEPFFHKIAVCLDKKDQQEIRKHLEWIDKTFETDSKSLLNDYWNKTNIE